jgi:putative ABC transport system permease protein
MSIPISYSVGNLLTRKFTTLLTAGGMALVAFVFAAVLMLAEGLEQTLVDTGSPDNAIVLRAAAETEVSSSVSRDQGAIVEVQPEVRRDPKGEPMAAKEALVLVTLKKRGADTPTNVVVRGIGPHSLLLRPQVKLLAGRFPKPGSREVIAGKSIGQRITDASLGGTLQFALADWPVVGIFDAVRTAFDSEVWADADQLMAGFRRNDFSIVVIRVPGSQDFKEVQKRLEGDPRLTVQVKREITFYREQSEMMSKFIRILGLALTLFFSMGAILGAMVTMYTAVANRTREIGTLRALGFGKEEVLLAFVTESVLLGIIGGVGGVAAASSLQLLTISTMNWQSFSELAFGFTLTPSIALYTMGFAILMGLLGGLLPAWRAAQLAIVDALRAT